MLGNVENYGGMPAKKTRHVPIYLGQWLARLDRKASALARHLGVNQSYITNLCSGLKTNPSVAILQETANWLGITIDDLLKEPPKAREVAHLRGYSQSAVRQLLESGTAPE